MIVFLIRPDINPQSSLNHSVISFKSNLNKTINNIKSSYNNNYLCSLSFKNKFNYLFECNDFSCNCIIHHINLIYYFEFV